ncbi:MAG: SMP-30/gluconolactonase/LRE family protein [Candidatus Kaistia colombiensis]|nr:MAG: SMP-30/gluconolactonase/LRE family protein [Kaistia sp.]
MTVSLVLDAADSVGESIVWDAARQRLSWVDIIGRRIHAFDPATGDHRIWRLAGRPTSIGLRADGGAIVGMERNICLWDWQGEPVPVREVEPDMPANRLNEGVVGPDGSFWIGTMLNNIAPDDSPRDAPEATGQLYRYDPDGRLTRLCDDAFSITNTFVWPASDRLVTADTPKNALYSYRIGADGTLADRQTVLQDYGRGLPDGSTMDAEGFIWTARVAGGACLTRMSPDGRIDRVVELPCSWPTSCAFGGPDLSTLFVTSARFTMTAEHLAANPQEGGLFAVDAGVRGLPGHRFGAGA